MNYDEDYYLRGTETGKSLYHNYRWLPELTIPLAHELMNIIGIYAGQRVLDYGCAFGYLVKALRLLHVDAWGCDTSLYARRKAPPDVANYLKHEIPAKVFTATIAKDVFEHIPEENLDKILYTLSRYSEKLFVIVPLGNGKLYHIPSYEADLTHVHRQPLEWWEAKLKAFYPKVDARTKWGHLKENWVKINPHGNGFLLASKQ